jgi:hypothetical protein
MNDIYCNNLLCVYFVALATMTTVALFIKFIMSKVGYI